MNGVLRCARAFARNEDGAMTILALLMTVMLLGLGALVVDIGRLYNLHSQMQGYVDQVALAAAAELDGGADAIERATRAALGDGTNPPMVRDVQNFAVGAAELSIQPLQFYRQIPPDNAADYDSLLAGFATTDPSEAEFVRARAAPLQENFFLMPLVAMIGSQFGADVATAVTAEAQAIAGFTREVCNTPPLMICNPFENVPPGNTGFTPTIGQQILIKKQGPGSAWANGIYALLQTVEGAGEPTCNGGLGGANRIRCVFGLISPNSQCVGRTVTIRGGQAESTNAGLNLRFDIWDPPFNTDKNNPAFRPARNVMKGLVPQNTNQCAQNKHDPAPDTVPLPRDSCFPTNDRFAPGYSANAASSGTPNACGSGRFGNTITVAALQGYWSRNHPGRAFPTGATTRFDVYRAEIDQGLVPRAAPERGGPTCAPGYYEPTPYDSIGDRRVLPVAIINCAQESAGPNVTADIEAFALMFLTEPVGDGPDQNIWAEMLGVVEPGDESGILHDYPVLYR